MKLLPYRTITLQTRLTKEQCVAALTKNMFLRSPEAFIFFEPKDVMFVGTLYGDSFKLRLVVKWVIGRVLRRHNTFRPIVNGRFKSIPTGTEITLQFRVPGFKLAFIIAWYSGVLAACIALTAACIANNGSSLGLLIIPYGMLIFGILLHTNAFLAGCETTRDELIQIFKAF